jgi:ABC-2 type transport system ATP-binding protein
MLQGRIHGMAGSPLRKRVDELLELVGLRDAADRVARGYSGGMKRRLDIAIGLVHRPRVLFLDEPTTGLDPEARAAMWVEVERLAEQESLTILLTTHYLEEADRLAERVAIVSHGTIVVEGTPDELKRNLEGESVTVELQEANGRLAEAQRIIEQVAGNVHVDGQLVRVRVPNGAQAIPVVLGALDAAGVDVVAVTTARPSLDDVYLHYTGRDFAREHQEGTS